MISRGSEVVPQHAALGLIPAQFPGWVGTDVSIPRDVREVLGPGDFLMRTYHNSQTNEAPVDLFIAYFPSQSAGDTIHSPKHCMPGAGWVQIHSAQINVALPGKALFVANRYLLDKGIDRMLVLYWYWAHNRAVASEYWAKFYLIRDSIEMNRSDGAMIRVNTILGGDEDVTTGQRRLVALASQISPIIDKYISP
jgi:EpsI family protein